VLSSHFGLDLTAAKNHGAYFVDIKLLY